MFELKNTKYHVQYTSRFKKEFKKVLKQGKNENDFLVVLQIIANGGELDKKYRNHKLINDKTFKDCNECHITPDWLLIYKVQDNELILLLFATGSQSDLFNK
jgi:mRNA interferase YafQ